MPAATNHQVQIYSDQRFRARAEQIRALKLAIEDDKAAIDDVYANLIDSPDWTDGREDGPPHLITPNDLLAYNTFLDAFIAFLDPNGNTATIATGADQWPIILDACVRPLGQ